MTAPEELDHEAGARFVEKLLAEDPARLDVATDEQVDAMMAAAGIEAGEPESVEQVLARGERRRRERAARGEGPSIPEGKPAPRMTTSRKAWVAGALVAAAAAAVVAVELGSKREQEAIAPDHPGPSPSPQQQAAWLRTDALTACNTQDFTTCTAKLDEAKRLDPAGESDPRVVQMRALLAIPSATPEPSTPEKPEPLKPR